MIIRLHLLFKNYKDKTSKAYYKLFKYTKIQHYEYIHLNILCICKAYNQVNPKNINNLWQKLSHPHIALSIKEKIKQTTEKLVILNIKFYRY